MSKDPQALQAARKAFKLFDKDNNKKLDSKQLTQLLNASLAATNKNFVLTEQQVIQTFIPRFDFNGDGKIDQDQLYVFFKQFSGK